MMKNLLLITVEGRDYGVREEDVRSVEVLQTLHKLPLAAACIAGISIRRERAVTLADLAVCLGHDPLDRSKRGHVLILSESEKIAGFAVAGGVRRIAAEAEMPLPAYLATPVVDSCIREGEALIPIVNIARLYALVQQTDRDIPVPLLVVPPLNEEARRDDGFRLFEIDGQLFAVSARCVKTMDNRPASIRTMQLVPQFVAGITWHSNTVLPLIDLSQRISLRRGSRDGLMVTAEVQGALFGLLVDGEETAGDRAPMSVAPLPPVAVSPWSTYALVTGQEVIPVLDLEKLLSGGENEERVPLREDVYTAASVFSDRFGSEDVEVVEFSLLGVRHAAPREETGDVLDFRPWRPLPGTSPIIAGVVALDGELFPVLDLATVFGRQSVAKPEWRLLRVSNGDFQALVMTEAVFGERRITTGMQRAVPIVLPHNVVYGCYPTEDAVRLILNVASLTVHYERELLQEFLPQLPEEKAEYAAEIPAASSLAEEHSETPGVPVAEANDRAASNEIPEEEIAGPRALSVSGPRTPGFVQKFDASRSRKADGDEYASAEPAASETGPSGAAVPEAQDMTDERAAEVEEPSSVSVPEQEQQDLAGQSNAEESLTETAADARVDSVDQGEMQDRVESAPIPPEERTEAGTEEKLPPAPEEMASQQGEEGQQSGTLPAEDTGTSVAEGERREPAAPASPSGYDLEERLPEQPAVSYEETVVSDEQAAGTMRTQEQGRPAAVETPPVSMPPAAETKRSTRRISIPVSIIGLVIVAALYFFGPFSTQEKDRAVKPAPPAEAPAAVPLEESKEPLVLDVPAGRKKGIDVYVVRKGDTLWDISERFTGSPWNYPRIAGENRIANPDLIFPDQKIRLREGR